MASVLMALMLITACGGGGGNQNNTGNPPPIVTSTLSFPLLSGFQTLFANGYTGTGAITGTCSGSGAMTVLPASTATTFEGQPALSATETFSRTYTNCAPASNTSTGTIYYGNGNYTPLGGTNIASMNSIGGWLNYGVFQTPPVIPASVRVGDSGNIGSIAIYTDSTKTTPIGVLAISYSITADTASSAIVWVYSHRFATGSSIPNFRVIERYRMTATGALTPLYKEGYNYSTGFIEAITIN